MRYFFSLMLSLMGFASTHSSNTVPNNPEFSLPLYIGTIAGVLGGIFSNQFIQVVCYAIAGHITSYIVTRGMRLGEIHLWGSLAHHAELMSAPATPPVPKPRKKPTVLRVSSYSLKGFWQHPPSTVLGLLLIMIYAVLFKLNIITAETAPIFLPILLFILYRGKNTNHQSPGVDTPS